MSELQMGEKVGCTNESLKERMKESIDSNHARVRVRENVYLISS